MNTTIKYLIWPILVAPAAYLAFAWNKLPEKVPMHYNISGEVDRYGSKTEMLAVMGIIIGINIGIYFLLVNINKIDPKKKYTAENLPRMRKLAFAISIFMSALACFIIYSSLHPADKFNMQFVVIAVGLLFVIIGNYMYNIKPNYFAGLRLPWTLESEDNWKQTHLLGGKLWFAGGLLIVLAGFVLPATVQLIFLLSVAALITIIPIVYSYRLYKKQLSGPAK